MKNFMSLIFVFGLFTIFSQTSTAGLGRVYQYVCDYESFTKDESIELNIPGMTDNRLLAVFSYGSTASEPVYGSKILFVDGDDVVVRANCEVSSKENKTIHFLCNTDYKSGKMRVTTKPVHPNSLETSCRYYVEKE
ncbi:hypothetical protein [Pseudobdellovibrio exovorus]|uniref:Uncharacterized protein n=1 Tax=Pseudobdellovibrio exovorus JSS TaxID=1184267 RepID=M4VBU7_9BACT|nr:hypothetical protein [Pseudobdellovibrio exovorus]AGH96708.1 hypothetical protein A11Q_2492 [Pseudobdellovibrio exovorus JSS]